MNKLRPEGRLGRGLANLIPDHAPSAPPQAAQRVRDIPIDLIERNPNQPRRRFTAEELETLAASIKADGVLTPVLLKPIKGGRYQLVAGERRWRAAGLAGLAEIPALLREAGDQDMLVWALAENMLRSDLSPIETADGLHELEERGLSHQEIGERLGLSRPAVSNFLRLRKLEKSILVALEEGRLTAGHARALLTLDSPELRRKLAQEIELKSLSVREAEARARAMGKDTPTGAGAKTAESPQQRSVRERFERALGGARVQLSINTAGTGKLVVPFFSHEELTRILEHLEREF